MAYPPFSYSALTDFEGCPKRFLQTKILKNYPFEVTEALTYGREVHKAFEDRVKDGKKLPPHLEHCESLLSGLEQAGYKLYAEISIAITKDFAPVDYWDKSAWFRGSIDVLAVRGTELIMFDWKTGKRFPDFGQLKLYSLILSATGVGESKGVYVWLRDKKSDTVQVTRAQVTTTPAGVSEIANLEKVREEYIHRADKFEAALQQPPDDAATWVARTSPLCMYCPVLNDCTEAAKYKARKKYLKR